MPMAPTKRRHIHTQACTHEDTYTHTLNQDCLRDELLRDDLKDDRMLDDLISKGRAFQTDGAA